MNEHVLELALPESAHVDEAVIMIQDRIDPTSPRIRPSDMFLNGFDSVGELIAHHRSVNHVLSLIPQEDIYNATKTMYDSGWSFRTRNLGAIKYAFRNNLINEWETLHNAAITLMTAGNECDDCCQAIIEFVYDSDACFGELKEVNGEIIAYYNITSNLKKIVTKSNA